MVQFDGVTIQKGGIVIYLDLEGAEWLASELPQFDGFTKDLWRAIKELQGDTK